ncbi:hypothetical protein RQP54_04790 [Curvibacter sp. APW13]|uniref:HD-GYP domain-containing protein n=1 Tax=Curvibacter sp. APW13 TaxID=3077236 RepID=UPI0028E024F6|nr:hypothetical protein [Curvibacter sp. APW13]MDT8990174.1 hypothetical protein [Curvibacter sp. APW13]
MKYLPIPIAMLQIGQPLPVTVWSNSGQLLLKKGNPILSEQHRDRLAEFNASTTYDEGIAWQRAYERMVHTALRDGMSVDQIAKLGMPTEIKEADYVVAKAISGGWPDLQEVLRGILYQGGLAINPLSRLAGIEKKALGLLRDDVDDSLFCMFQMLADSQIGYSATHALLCGSICHLTAKKLGMSDAHAQLLMSAALTMNIGMARDQDSLALQNNPPTDWQRELIRNHPQISVDILKGFGVDDETHLDIVRWHHGDPDNQGLERTVASRRVLTMADVFVAKMAARKTRAALSPVGAVKDMVLGAEGDNLGVGSAMAQAVGFYPPGTYLRLENGLTAVSIRRGARANTPWVVPIIDKEGMPVLRYQALDTAKPENQIAAPLSCDSIKVSVNLEKIRRVRERLPALEAK